MDKDILKTLEAIGINPTPSYAKNANEVMNTDGSGVGQELLPDEVLAQEIFDAVPSYSTFLDSLPGNHGSGLDEVQKVATIGDPGFFALGSEQTTSALAVAQGNSTMPTGEVTITQKKYEMTIDVSRELATFNRMGAAKFEQVLREKIAKSMARTVEALIVNGDTTNAATGNVNLDDADPGDTLYYLGANGLRYEAIAGTGLTSSVGTFDQSDLITVYDILGDYGADPSDVMWLFNRATYNKALGIQAFYDASQRGEGSTLSGKAITNILGADVFIARDMPKTEADGKVSTTASNNTKGQFGAFWKPCVQFGFGDALQLKLMDYGKDGYQLQGWFFFGFDIVQTTASQTDSSVALGINVTL